jgi:hypothetical protein
VKPRVALALLAALAGAAALWISLGSPLPLGKPSTAHRASAAPVWESEAPAPRTEPWREVVADWSALGQQLDAMGADLGAVATQREVSRIVARWLELDRRAAVAWLARHRGEARFDPIAAGAAQCLVASGDYATAQTVAETIVLPELREWAHREAWAAAYERRLVGEADVRASGLSAASAAAIMSGAHRD